MKNNFGILGENISYTLSPNIHQAIGKYLNQNLSYNIFDINKDQLKAAVLLLKDGEINGFNVTKPYKENALDFVDELSNEVKEIQAINTLYIKDGKIIGDNTDVFGFEYLLDYYQIDVKQKNILILGTGGASKAVAYVLSKRGATYKFASRNQIDKDIISYQDINPIDYDIYINATPIGTTPNIEASPLKKEQVTHQIIIDLIYRPAVTKLMSYSNKSYNGFMMLLAQAVKSEILWLNQSIDIHKMIDHLKEVIKYE